MTEIFRTTIRCLRSDNPKSKTCTESRRSIQNLKWAALSVIVFVLVVAGAAAHAQPARIGILGPAEEPRFTEILSGLKQGLTDYGYSAGTLEILEGRVSRGDQTSARAAVEGLIQRQAKVLFVIGSELARLARQVSPEISIVFVTPGDPVASGLAASLARPGDNMTAMTFEYPELAGKRLEILKQIAPRSQRILAPYDPRDASPRQGLAAARHAAPQLGVTLVEQQIQSRAEVTKALAGLSGADALLAIPGGLLSGYYEEMIRAAKSRRVPTMFHSRAASTMDALASYGANDSDIARQAARLVDKILKGSNAGDIPVERPTKLEFVVNFKTAKQIGLTIPPNVLARADRVIK